MKIKKFKALSLREGKERILNELGEEAIILSSRNLNNSGADGNTLEIIAAVDDSNSDTEDIQFDREKYSVNGNHDASFLGKNENRRNYISSNNINHFSGMFDTELEKIMSILGDISDNIYYRQLRTYDEPYLSIYKKLIDNDFSDKFACKVTNDLIKSNYSNNKKNGVKSESNLETIEENKENIVNDVDWENLNLQAGRIATSHIRTTPHIKKSNNKKLIIFFGPTGTGKTTSLVKLAIVSKLVYSAKIMLITLDNQKVSGAEQLQTYASIAGIPFKVVYTPDELKNAIELETDKDFIFIDTAGISQYNLDKIIELSEFINNIENAERILVQQATTNKSNFEGTVKEFSLLNPTSILLTKLDEASTIGNIVEAMLNVKLPLIYFSNGQKIPDDIEPATLEMLSKLCVKN